MPTLPTPKRVLLVQDTSAIESACWEVYHELLNTPIEPARFSCLVALVIQKILERYHYIYPTGGVTIYSGDDYSPWQRPVETPISLPIAPTVFDWLFRRIEEHLDLPSQYDIFITAPRLLDNCQIVATYRYGSLYLEYTGLPVRA